MLAKKVELLAAKEDWLDSKLAELKKDEKREAELVVVARMEVEKLEKDISRKEEQILASTPAEHQDLLTKLQKLIGMNEKYKKREAEFRKTCQEELKKLQVEIGFVG